MVLELALRSQQQCRNVLGNRNFTMLKWKEKVVKEILYALRRVELLRVPAQGRLSVVGVSSRMDYCLPILQPEECPFLQGTVLGMSAFGDIDISSLFPRMEELFHRCRLNQTHFLSVNSNSGI